MRIIVPLVIAILLAPLAMGSGFPEWSRWEFSDMSKIQIDDGVLRIHISNESLEARAVFGGIEKGDRISMRLEYHASKLSVVSGLRVEVDGGEGSRMDLIDSGVRYINITCTRGGDLGVSLVFYVVQGSLWVNVSSGKIVSPPRGVESGLLISGVGITTVFIVLGLLSGVMYAFGALEREEREEKEEEVKDVANAHVNGIPPEDLVAIMAAIQEYMKGRKFRIISVKPSPWKYYGRLVSMRRWR